MTTEKDTTGARRRSTEHPRQPLGEVIGFVKRLSKLAGSADSLAISKVMDDMKVKNRTNDRFSSLLSAARQFGLVTVKGTTITLTPVASKMMHGTETTRRALLIRAANSPKLYADLISKYDRKGLPAEAALAAELFEGDYGIVKTKTRHAAAMFIASVRDADLVTDSGILRALDPQELGDQGLSQEGLTVNQDTADKQEQTEASTASSERAPISAASRVPDRARQSSTLQLGDGRSATVDVPGDLTAQEADRLKKLLDVLVSDRAETPSG